MHINTDDVARICRSLCVVQTFTYYRSIGDAFFIGDVFQGTGGKIKSALDNSSYSLHPMDKTMVASYHEREGLLSSIIGAAANRNNTLYIKPSAVGVDIQSTYVCNTYVLLIIVCFGRARTPVLLCLLCYYLLR